jgi:hypothetical protein
MTSLRSCRVWGLFWVLVALVLIPMRASAQTIYAVDNSNDRLLRVDKDTGAATVVGPLGFDTTGAGLTTKPDGTLWGLLVDGGTTGLYSIDTSTGAATLSVALDRYIGGFGAEFDPSGTTLYIVSSNALFTADPTTGTTTFLGTMSNGFTGLAVSPSGTFYGTQSNLYTVDVTIPDVVLVGAIQGTGPTSTNLAYDSSSGMLYSIAGNRLVRLDPVTLQGTEVGPLGLSAGVGGIAVLPAPVSVESKTWSSVKALFH